MLGWVVSDSVRYRPHPPDGPTPPHTHTCSTHTHTHTPRTMPMHRRRSGRTAAHARTHVPAAPPRTYATRRAGARRHPRRLAPCRAHRRWSWRRCACSDRRASLGGCSARLAPPSGAHAAAGRWPAVCATTRGRLACLIRLNHTGRASVHAPPLICYAQRPCPTPPRARTLVAQHGGAHGALRAAWNHHRTRARRSPPSPPRCQGELVSARPLVWARAVGLRR